MKKLNLSKIGEFVKSNKAGIVGIIGLAIAEIGFMKQGFNDGYHEGAEDGSNYVYNKVEKIDPETQKILKEELIKDGCDFYD